MVGLGKMGGNMAERLRRAGHEVVGYDRSSPSRDVTSLPELVEALSAPRVVWVMVPSGEPTRATVKELSELLSPGDVVIEGGNSKYTDDQVHDVLFREKDLGYIDAGVSGGVWGLENGYALMVGGSDDDVAKVAPALEALAPPNGFAHVGPVGAGHYSKMVHNGIEYGMMQAYAEGFAILHESELGIDALAAVKSWQQGSVVRSWLLDLLVLALDESPAFEGIRGVAADSGEGRWTVNEAVRLGVAAPVISAALFARFVSQDEDQLTMKVVAALRHQFGGHTFERAP
jgi:6-phosphogluconate dehydrogenase